MKAFRILHKPTGLYYCPSREIQAKIQTDRGQTITRYVKSNLSKSGKVYARKPTLKHIGEYIYTHLVTHENQLKRGKYCLVPVIDDHWEIQEI